MSILSKVIKGILGDKSAKDKKIILPMVHKINEFQESLNKKSNEELKENYQNLKIELSNLIKSKKEEFVSLDINEDEIDDKLYEIEKTFLDDKVIEVFALVKESAKRLIGTSFSVMGQPMKWDMVHYDVQLMGGIVLHQGKIAEMKTGEGKTLVSTLPIILNSLSGRGILQIF